MDCGPWSDHARLSVLPLLIKESDGEFRGLSTGVHGFFRQSISNSCPHRQSIRPKPSRASHPWRQRVRTLLSHDKLLTSP